MPYIFFMSLLLASITSNALGMEQEQETQEPTSHQTSIICKIPGDLEPRIVALCPQARRLVVSFSETEPLRIFKAKNGNCINEDVLKHLQHKIEQILFNNKGTHFITLANGSWPDKKPCLNLFDKRGNHAADLECIHDSPIRTAEFSPDDRYLITISDIVKFGFAVWDGTSGALIRTLVDDYDKLYDDYIKNKLFKKRTLEIEELWKMFDPQSNIAAFVALEILWESVRFSRKDLVTAEDLKILHPEKHPICVQKTSEGLEIVQSTIPKPMGE